MAILTASLNPVGVWGESGSRTVTITWNTESVQRGRVYLKVATEASVPLDETLFDGDPTIGARNGAKPLTVTFGSTYTLTLRQVSNNAVMATQVVTVVDMTAAAGERAAAEAALLERINPSQAILDLRIVPGIDTVRVSFRTSQPTIPLIQATTIDGTELSSSFALAAGLQTQHEAILGGPSALPQATLLEVRILAAGTNFRGQPRDARASARFMTGTRQATIYFETLKVTRDADGGPSGAGDFEFDFMAGGVDGEAIRGEPLPPRLEQDIDENDPPVALGRELELMRAPRTIWVQVAAWDDDVTIFTGGLDVPGRGHPEGVPGEGSSFRSYNMGDSCRVTRHFEIGGRDGRPIIPMTLASGDFRLAFTVTGHIFVRTTPGYLPVSKPFIGSGAFSRESALLANAGKIARVQLPLHAEAEHTPSLRKLLLGRGAEGSVYRKLPSSSEKPQRNAEWALVAPAIDGPITCIARAEDRLSLLALDGEGAVQVAEAAGDSAGAWRSLGGRFVDRIAAVARGDAIELFALDREGAVCHRRLAGKANAKGEWQRIGEGAAGELAAVPIGDDGCAVFALGRGGQVLHRLLRHGDWQTEEWQTIRGAEGAMLGVVPAGPNGIALALIGDDMALRTLQWAGYPKRQPDWIARGDLQDWLVGADAPLPKPRKMRAALSA